MRMYTEAALSQGWGGQTTQSRRKQPYESRWMLQNLYILRLYHPRSTIVVLNCEVALAYHGEILWYIMTKATT